MISDSVFIIVLAVLALFFFYLLIYRLPGKYKKIEFSDIPGVFSYHQLNLQINLLLKDPEIKSFVLMLIDIDEFKNYNNKYGSRKGDELLEYMMGIIAGRINNTHLFFRYKNADKFAIIFNNITLEQTRETGNQLRREIKYHPFIIDKQQYNLTISVGITGSFKDDTPEKLKKRAELALHEAKQTKNAIVLIEE